MLKNGMNPTDVPDNGRALPECHGHIFMDGFDFRAALERHREKPDEAAIRQAFSSLQKAGCVYFRDGGDNLGVSLYAGKLAAEYGIEYRSPAFALYHKGLYGGIVGKSFSDMAEFRLRIEELKKAGADFLKLIVSGIITFRQYGELSCEGMKAEEIKECIHIAHSEGFKVMVHANGAEAISAASQADSMEHGYFCSLESLEAMAQNDCIWVPTLTAVAAFKGRKGFPEGIVETTLKRQADMVILGKTLGIPIAPGSDSGAFGVYHGLGIRQEFAALESMGISFDELDNAAEKLKNLFNR